MVSRWDLLCSYMIKKNKKPKSPSDKINVKAALDYLTGSSGMPNNVPHYPRLLRAEACHFIWITSSYYFSCRAFHFKQSDSRNRDKSVTALLQVVWFLWPFVIQPTLSVFWHDNSSKVIHIKKKKCLEPLNELWNISHLSLFHLSNVFTLALCNYPWITSAKPVTSCLGGIKKKDAFKVPFSRKERLCSLRLSASFASEWAEVRKCVNSCCGLFPWESDLPLFQELYCEQPEWWPKANEPLGYKQRVGEVFLSPVSADLAVIVIFL